MQADNSQKKSLKQKVAHEFKEVVILTAYLAFFFSALAAHSMFLLGKFKISYFAFGAALINAAVIAKVILIGEALRAGARYERKALFYSALWKAFVFGWLVFGFHLVEEMIKHLIHGQKAVEAFHEIHLDELLSRTVVIIGTFVPLFLFRELKRVMGDDAFWNLVLHSPSTSKASPSKVGATFGL
ncbi:MAG TPA: hypothetical protein VN749_21445 [Candidatus Eisenbacteria bacterium]|jgi:hypothetical protein|nr:hypothetical protein [Candidatus Eisenbacteria bacterium]